MKITKLVVHCSDTPNDRDVSAQDIHQWHLERGWSGIGYHKVIKRDGTIKMEGLSSGLVLMLKGTIGKVWVFA